MVTMRELIDSDKFRNSKSKLTTVLGRDISGEIVVTDLAKMPHLLIAGTTGSDEIRMCKLNSYEYSLQGNSG